MSTHGRSELMAKLLEVLEKYAKYVGLALVITSVVTFSLSVPLLSYLLFPLGCLMVGEFLWRVRATKIIEQPPALIALPDSVARLAQSRYLYTPRERWLATVGLVLLPPLAAAWIGYNLYTDLKPPVAPARSGEVLIIVSEFKNRGSTQQELAFDQDIMTALQEAQIPGARIEPLEGEPISDEDEAAEIGSRTRATLVIWGWFDKERVEPSYWLNPQAGADKGVTLLERPNLNSELDRFSLLSDDYVLLTEFTLGQVYYLSGEYEGALAHFENPAIQRVLDRSEQSTLQDLEYLYFYRGLTNVRLSNYYPAVADYQKAIDAARESGRAFPEADNNLGLVYSEHPKELDPDRSRALESFRKASLSGLAIAFYNRGNVYYETKEFDQAIEDYNRAIERLDITPQLPLVYFNRGLARDKTCDHPGAIEDFTQAILLATPEEPEWWCRFWLGCPPPMSPINPEYYLARANSYLQNSEYETSLADYTKVIEELTSGQDLGARTEALTNRGMAYTRLGDYPAAIADYQSAISLNAGYARAYYNLAAALSLSRDFEAALSNLDQARTLNARYASLAACDTDFASMWDMHTFQKLSPPRDDCPQLGSEQQCNP